MLALLINSQNNALISPSELRCYYRRTLLYRAAGAFLLAVRIPILFWRNSHTPTLRSNDAIHTLEHIDVRGEPNAVAMIDPRGHHFHTINSAHVPVICFDILCARLA